MLLPHISHSSFGPKLQICYQTYCLLHQRPAKQLWEVNLSAFNNGDNTTCYNFCCFIWICISKKHSFVQPAVVRYCIHTDSSVRFFISVASLPFSDKNGDPDISFTVLLSMYSPIVFTISREVAKDLYVAFPKRLLKTCM